MVTLALAGRGRLGNNIIKALESSPHKLVAISRSPQPDLTAKGIPVHVFDYTSSGVPALSAFLEEHHVDTVYSCIFSFVNHLESQLLLLEAAKQAGVVKRFAPSEWAFPAYKTIDTYAVKLQVWDHCLKSGLEVTRFLTGAWTNMFASGAIKDVEEAKGGTETPPIGVQMDKRSATLLLDGESKVTYTRIQDIAALAVKALDLPKWEPDSFIGGDTISWNTAVEIAEEVTGEKFEVTYLTAEDLEKKLKSDDFMTKLIAQYELAVTRDELHIKPGEGVKTLNELFPEVKIVTVREYLERHFRE